MSSAEIGKKLRRARLDQKKRFPELQAETKIQADYLRKLEDGQFDFFPEPTIVGFIKAYAQALDLDAEGLIKHYEQSGAQRQVETRQPPVMKMTTAAAGRHESEKAADAPKTSAQPAQEAAKTAKPASSGPTPAAAGRWHDDSAAGKGAQPASRAPAAAVGRGLRSGWMGAHRGELILGSVALVIVVAIAVIYVRYGGDPAPEPAQPVEKISVFEARQQNIDSAETAKPEIEPIRLPETVKLRVVAAETTWVRLVLDAVDTSEYIFRPGNDRSFEADSLIEIRLGRADGLIFWVNSDSLGKMGTAAEIVSRLVITEQGITERRVRPPITQAAAPPPDSL